MKRMALTTLFIFAIGLTSFGAVDEFSSKTIMIGMIVSDLDQSLHFYKDIVGMVQVERARFDVDADFGKQSGLTDNLPIHVEVLKLGFGEDATQLKLMTFGDRARKQENDYIHSHTGVQYLTFSVANLAPIYQRIQENNIPLLGETPLEMGDNHFILIQDPDGTFVELIGPMEIKPPSQYQIMKEQSNFDAFKKELPYKTPSRSKTEIESSKKFDFFGLFRSKEDKSGDDQGSVESDQEIPASESKAIRDKFKRFKKTTPYKTPSNRDAVSNIP
ncbi:MAG: VOC family protein [Candidatus Omnitrophica bacterium]|nr:VOC family protein [Candidatus Omnitrophota bacterium]